MTKREEDNVQQEDIRFGRDVLGRALWRLSLVLRDIAAADDQADKPRDLEEKEPQAPDGDTPEGSGREGESCE